MRLWFLVTGNPCISYCLLQVRAEETAENMYAAIENVSDVVARKMRKVKEKAIASGNWEGTAGPRGHSFNKVHHFLKPNAFPGADP